MRYLYATDCRHCEGGCSGSFTANCPREAWWVEEGERDLPENEMRELAAKNPNGLAAAAVKAADRLPRLHKFREARLESPKERYAYVSNCQHCEEGCVGPLTEQCPRQAWWSEKEDSIAIEGLGNKEFRLRENAKSLPGSMSDALVRAADGQPRLHQLNLDYYSPIIVQVIRSK